MNSKQKKVYEAIFKNPVQSDIEWQEIEIRKSFTFAGSKNIRREWFEDPY